MSDNETEQNRLDQARIITEWAPLHGKAGRRIGAKKPQIDYALMADGEVCGFAEIKTCSYRFGAESFGGGYKLAVNKMTAAAEAGFAFSVPVYLVVEFSDALAWLSINVTPCQRGHQLKRDDRNAVRNAVLFRWDQFTVDRMVAQPSLAVHAKSELNPRPPA